MLERLKSTLDKSIAAVSVKSEVLVENSKIKAQIQNLDRERAALVNKLGVAMYEMWGTNSFSREVFQQMCEAIRACEDGIAEQNRRLEQIKREEQQILGTAQTPRAPAPPQGAPMGGGVVCACGVTNTPDARFCVGCGTKLG